MHLVLQCSLEPASDPCCEADESGPYPYSLSDPP
jgi:hypothetical protein